MPPKLLGRALAMTFLVAGVGYLLTPHRADRADLGRGEVADAPASSLYDDGRRHVALVLLASDSSDVRTTFDARLVGPDRRSVPGTPRGAGSSGGASGSAIF